MTPRVSVVVPTRNRLGTLRRALTGVEAQRFRDFEVLVIDDGSTDGTAAWLHAERPGVRVLATGGAGSAAARNAGIEHARGELVAFLDDDDVWRPAYLEAQVEHLDANPAAALSWADHFEVGPGGRASRPDTRALLVYASPLVRLLAESFIHTMSVVVCRRSIFDDFGRFAERLAIVHDLDWYSRLLAGGGSFVHLERALVGRGVPGGLVTLHRRWFREERSLLDEAFAASPAQRTHERMVRAYRSLYFARVGLAAGDLPFGLLRLGEAFLTSPHWTVAIACRRVLRRLQAERGPEPRDAAASNAL